MTGERAGVDQPGGTDQPGRGALPATQRAIQVVAADQVLLNPAKPVPSLLPTQLLVKVEAVGICFSDTKLLHAFTSHPRKGPVLSGIDPAILAEIPSYVPGDVPTVPGHEVCGRIVAVGTAVARHRVGERVLVQTDYRHLPTDGANASFGYTFEGGLQEYVLMDERVIIEPDTGERFLIPVDEAPSASAVALLEPWACVERAYATEERGHLAPGGRLLVVVDAGHTEEGMAELLAGAAPAHVTHVADSHELPGGPFDDIVYFGSDAGRIEELERRLAPRGVIDIVLGRAVPARPVEVDVGRIHYDLTRWVGTIGSSAAAGYAMAPGTAELRDGERVVVIGAGGPMGFMHVIRALTSDHHRLDVTAADIDPARLEHLSHVATPIAAARGVDFRVVDSRETPLEPGFTRLGVMVPSPALAADAVRLAGDGAILDLFAGFAVGTRAPLDLGELIRKRVYMIGTSGSVISDMKAVLAKLEAGTLDTNISVDAVAGMEGVGEALAAVQARTSGGKIVIYPALGSVGMIRLPELASSFPEVAAALDGGRWTRRAEDLLLAAGESGGSEAAPSAASEAAHA